MSIQESALDLGEKTPKGREPKRCKESYSLTLTDIRVLSQLGYKGCVVHVQDRGLRLATVDGHCIFCIDKYGVPICELKEHGDGREPTGCQAEESVVVDILEKYAAVPRDVPPDLWYESPELS